RATDLAAIASDSLGRSSISLAAIARSKRRCSGSAAGVASSRASNGRKLDGVTNCKPRYEEPFAIKRALRSLACPRVGTTTSTGKSRCHAPGKTWSNQGAIASSHASRSDGTMSRTGREGFINAESNRSADQISASTNLARFNLIAQCSTITHSPCETLAIELLKQRDNNAPRAL